LSATDVAVALAGGRSDVYLFQDPVPPAFTRHVHGRVVDAHGNGVAGAVVIAGAELRVQFDSLLGESGAVSAADGSFDIAAHDPGALFALALDTRGWSAPTPVPADASELALAIGTPGTLALHVRQHDEARDADIEIAQPGMRLRLDTDAHGELALSRLAPGRYHVSAWPAQGFAGGASPRIEQDVVIREGATSDTTLKLSVGTLLAATPSHTQPLSTIEYFLATGSAQPTLDELKQRARAGEVLGTLFGGQDLDRPMQFHDLDAGTYTLCVDARTPERVHLALDCRAVEIRANTPVVEVDVNL
jgi:hypothetical protein